MTVRKDDLKGEVEVFYRTRFISPPQLTFPEQSRSPGHWNCRVTEQKAGSFKLQRDVKDVLGYPPTVPIRWRAEGSLAR